MGVLFCPTDFPPVGGGALDAPRLPYAAPTSTVGAYQLLVRCQAAITSKATDSSTRLRLAQNDSQNAEGFRFPLSS